VFIPAHDQKLHTRLKKKRSEMRRSKALREESERKWLENDKPYRRRRRNMIRAEQVLLGCSHEVE
jgi:hypothetical protein